MKRFGENMARFFVIMLCFSIVSCSDNAINNAVAPATERIEKMPIEDVISITDFKDDFFLWRGQDNDWTYQEGFHIGLYHDEEVWLIVIGNGELAIGQTIREPEILSDYRRKVYNADGTEIEQVRLIEIRL